MDSAAFCAWDCISSAPQSHRGEYDIIHASETEQHHALYCAVRRFRRAIRRRQGSVPSVLE